jgi:hypothetical protein
MAILTGLVVAIVFLLAGVMAFKFLLKEDKH